jgi:hypothetical protein
LPFELQCQSETERGRTLKKENHPAVAEALQVVVLDERIGLRVGSEAVEALPAVVDRRPRTVQVGRIDGWRPAGLRSSQGLVNEPAGDRELDRRRRVLRQLRKV